jgi:serine protease
MSFGALLVAARITVRRIIARRLPLAIAASTLVGLWLMDPAVAAQFAVPRVAAPSVTLTHARVDALMDARRRGLNYLPGEVLVKFRSGVSRAGQQRALMALRSRPSVDALRWERDVAVLRDDSQPDARVLAQQLAEQPEVEYAQPNFIRRRPAIVSTRTRAISSLEAAAPGVTPNDTDFADLQWNFSLINVPAAWLINRGSTPDVIVAVIDTGITTRRVTTTMPLWTGSRFESVPLAFGVSPDLTASRFVSPIDYEPVVPDSDTATLDFVGHGTHVASTLGEDTNNAKGLAGIAYNVRIMPIKVCVGYWELMLDQAQRKVPGFLPDDAGGCFDDDIVAGIHYAVDNGAKVINLSIGGTDPSSIERDALQYAADHGVFVAIAMGNDGDTGNPTEYPSSYAPAIDGVMSVSAVGKNSDIAYYSSTGPYNEIAAPGGDDRVGGGDDDGFIWQVTLLFDDQDPAIIRPRFDRYVEVGYEGTSMATPHVAGLAALLMSQGSLRNPKTIEAMIKATAKDLGPPGKDATYGFGLLQAREALRGFGIIK